MSQENNRLPVTYVHIPALAESRIYQHFSIVLPAWPHKFSPSYSRAQQIQNVLLAPLSTYQ